MSLVRALNATSRVHRCLNHSIRARPALGVIAHARAFSRSPVARADDDDGLNEFDEDFGPASSAEAVEEPEEEGGRRRRTEKAGSEDSDDAGSGSDAGDGEGEGDTKTRVRLGPFRGPSIQVYQDTIFHSWKSAEGNQYRTPGSYGRNYLGGDRPFPLNPSFQPPVPMSDRRRTEIFVEYMRGGMTVRELSRKFNISLRRVEAVLRLKHLELEWRQVRAYFDPRVVLRCRAGRLHDDFQRLVFKTHSWLQTFNMHGFLIFP
ncbi:hypothetical protein EXIGLDRAFT_682952 [Exidia glandulosa HHB12029]|uniref:Uncharacterized protein n=1 Tax=Exidia glandulosa HHB12029 TaxID=1314781 RepID=A0A165DDT6_EXIGL|nr:hypothetical protein EXIGLDRAFT_682952 [Exidia glandulosa HHB12029]